MEGKGLESAMDIVLWKRTLLSLNNAFRLNSLAIDLDGRILFEPEYLNKFCSILATGYSSDDNFCKSTHQDLIAEGNKTRSPIACKCECGFLRFVLPVRYKGKFIGCVGGCGAMSESDLLPVEKISKIAENLDLPAELLIAEAKENTIRFSVRTIDTYFTLLEKRLQYRLQ